WALGVAILVHVDLAASDLTATLLWFFGLTAVCLVMIVVALHFTKPPSMFAGDVPLMLLLGGLLLVATGMLVWALLPVGDHDLAASHLGGSVAFVAGAAMLVTLLLSL